MLKGPALVAVSTEKLRLLLSLLHRRSLAFPLGTVELTRHGLQEQSALLLGTLRGLDETGVRAVLVAVLAERSAR